MAVTARIPLPRLLDEGFREAARLHPARLSVTLNLRPLSRATLLLPPGERVSLRQWVELFTPQGSAGVFRVTEVSEAPGEGCEATLLHGAVSLADALLPGSGELTGSGAQVLAALLSGQSLWAPGEVELPEDRPLACAYNNSNLLTALGNLLDELPEYGLCFDQSALPWKIHLRRLDGADACECRLTRNLRSLTVSVDDSELCTRVYMNSRPAPVDAASAAVWGPVSRHLTANRRLNAEALTALARQYLERHSEPAVTVALDALDLHRATGEAFDRFPPGRICRVALPLDGRVIRQRVVAVRYDDVYGEPERAVVTLANRARDTADYVGGLMANVQVLYRGLADVNGVITLEAERIELLAKEIALKASSDVVDALERRTTLAEIDIDGLKGEIVLKATQKVVDALGTRLSQAEIDIDGAKADILLKASRKEVDDLSTRLSQAEIDIDGAKADILLKASQEQVNDISDNLSGMYASLTAAWIDINGAKADILLKATKEEVSELGKRLSQAEIDIDGANAEISLKASQEQVNQISDSLSGMYASLTAAWIDINGAKASVAAHAETLDAQGRRLAAAELTLNGDAEHPSLTARIESQETVSAGLYAWIEDTGSPAVQLAAANASRLDSAEARITLTENGIEQKVSRGDIASTINQTAQSVLISAGKIDLEGYVTASRLEAEVASINQFFSGVATAQSLRAGLLAATTSFSYQGTTVSWHEIDVITDVRLSTSSGTAIVNSALTGSQLTLTYLTSASLIKDTATIKYLGIAA